MPPKLFDRSYAATKAAGLDAGLDSRVDVTAASEYRMRVRQRRRRALQLLMAAGAICALVIYLVLRWYAAQPAIETNDLTPFATAMLLMCGSIAVTYALARWVSNDVASIWLLTTGVLLISIADAPERIYTGPALVAYAVPILAAGVLLPAWTTFVFAGLSMVAVLTASLVAPIDIVPVPAMLVFLVIALITWYFAQSVERANQELSHANAELKRSEADFRLLFADNPLPMAVVDAHTFQVLEVNDAACAHYGYTREELYQIAPEAVLVTGPAMSQDPAQTGWPYSGEQQHCTKDGRPIDIAIMANAIRYAGRDAILVVAQDITERKQAEQQLYLMRRVVEQSPVSIAIFTPQGELEFVNRKFIEMTGYTLEEVKNLPANALRAQDQLPAVGKQIEAVLTAGGEWHGETRRQRKNGDTFWEAISISRVIDPTGTIVHHLAIAEDVTARHEAEDALRTLNAELEQRVEERTAELRRANIELARSARLKDEFLATMSHELRTPLTGVLAGADLLAENIYGPLNDRQQRSVAMIKNSGQHLLELINGVLDLSKIEAGGMTLDSQPVRVAELCTSALAMVREQAAQKQLSLTQTISASNLVVEADPRRLKQMLVNLLSNAVKFTPERGSIGLDVVADPVRERIRLSVWDTGIGIAADQLPRLFQPFTQLDSGLNREYGGTGLGLALVRKFAELHGGGVGVESTLGEGSRFTIYLPWQAPATQPAAVAAAPAPALGMLPWGANPQGPKPRVLLAEDSPNSIEVVVNVLESVHLDVTVVQRGDEAVRAAIEQQPDLILMDIQMPQMDGIEAMSLIRSHVNPAVANIPIIALTALAMPGDRERCLAAGANDYISKPYPLRQLLDAIAHLLGAGTSPGVGCSPAADPPTPA